MIHFYFRYRLRGTSYENQRQKLARNGSVDTQKEIVMLSCHFFYLITFNKTFVFIKKYLKLTNISWIFSCFFFFFIIHFNFSECKTAKKKLKKVKKEKKKQHTSYFYKKILIYSHSQSMTHPLIHSASQSSSLSVSQSVEVRVPFQIYIKITHSLISRLKVHNPIFYFVNIK